MIEENNVQIQIKWKYSQKGSCITWLGEIIKNRNLILNTRNLTKRTTKLRAS